MTRILAILCALLLAAAVHAQETPEPDADMTLERLARIIVALDPDAQSRGPTFEFTIADIPIIVIADPRADRMRAMVPIRSAESLDAAELMRLMQANFDSALDARYAVAQGRLWGVYIHPLGALKRDQFVSGIAQTVNVARTYGQTYSGGASVFGGGDSNSIYQDLIDELRQNGEEL